MFKPSRRRGGGFHPGPARGRTAALLAAAALLMLLPYLSNALAGVDLDERRNALAAPPPASAVASAKPLYQVRCWQYGRLLFEENDVELPADIAAAGLKLRGSDRHQRPVYLAETSNATCLIRGVPPDRARAGGR